jgi:hypothetical protein
MFSEQRVMRVTSVSEVVAPELPVHGGMWLVTCNDPSTGELVALEVCNEPPSEGAHLFLDVCLVESAAPAGSDAF